MTDFRQEFIGFAVKHGVIRFGEFKTKAGRMSPYFFNAGLFNDGLSMSTLSGYYAQAVKASGIPFDMLFGPAYKGIPLATGAAIALVEKYDRNVPFAYNRKEAKDHGEGGNVIGAPLKGRVLIVDDVISAGTSVRETIDLIGANGAKPAGVVIALDRMEYGLSSELSAVQEVEREFGIPVISVASLDDLVQFLKSEPQYQSDLEAVLSYRRQYGVD
ncbi:MAG: orotate phosphoribosyltransferase [Pseudomonadota bacterium]|nr:orotate phosphoribosyltransferase [Pseudomonadota bacterium]